MYFCVFTDKRMVPSFAPVLPLALDQASLCVNENQAAERGEGWEYLPGSAGRCSTGAAASQRVKIDAKHTLVLHVVTSASRPPLPP